MVQAVIRRNGLEAAFSAKGGQSPLMVFTPVAYLLRVWGKSIGRRTLQKSWYSQMSRNTVSWMTFPVNPSGTFGDLGKEGGNHRDVPAYCLGGEAGGRLLSGYR